MPENQPPPSPSSALSPASPGISRGERAARQGHAGMVIWLTGLSGAGKSTLCRALERELFRRGHQVFALEGDDLRQGLNANLGFSAAERQENVRRAAEVAKLFSQAGFICIMALISPTHEIRRQARKLITESGSRFVQVWVNAALEVCEGRDVKGLYRRARAGEIPEFTGITSPFDTPVQSEIIVQTDQQTVAQSVETVLAYLQPLLREADAGAQAQAGPEI